jgi:uncharacterized protein (DUF58 family)
MKPLLLFGTIALSLIFIGLFTLNGMMLALALPFVIYLGAHLVFPAPEIDLVIERRMSAERIGPNQPATITVTVTNQGATLEDLVVEDRLSPSLSLLNGSPRHLLRLEHEQSQTWEYTVSGERGYYDFSSIEVEARSPLGLMQTRQTLPTQGQLLVLPPLMKLKNIQIRPRKTRVYSGEIPTRNSGLGIEFYGVRDFQQGDSPAWINWLLSAKHPERLFSNEFEQERVSDVGIILDGRAEAHLISEEQSIFEYAVSATAALSNTFIAQGNRVSFLHYGEFLQWTFPGYGKYQLERILRALTQVETGNSIVFSYLKFLPTRIFPPQSQIVLVSPLLPNDVKPLLQIRGYGYRVLVISPDRIAYESATLPRKDQTQLAARILTLERKILLRELMQGGVRVVNWDVSQPFDIVMQNLNRQPLHTRTAEAMR